MQDLAGRLADYTAVNSRALSNPYRPLCLVSGRVSLELISARLKLVTKSSMCSVSVVRQLHDAGIE